MAGRTASSRVGIAVVTVGQRRGDTDWANREQAPIDR